MWRSTKGLPESWNANRWYNNNGTFKRHLPKPTRSHNNSLCLGCFRAPILFCVPLLYQLKISTVCRTTIVKVFRTKSRTTRMLQNTSSSWQEEFFFSVEYVVLITITKKVHLSSSKVHICSPQCETPRSTSLIEAARTLSGTGPISIR